VREGPTTCGKIKNVRVSRGVLGKGTESFTTRPVVCGATTAPDSDLCPMHLAVAARWEAKLAAKKARNA
jgi:hypothetical protein